MGDKPLRIGLIIDQLDTVYSSGIYRTAMNLARKRGVQLMIFTAGSVGYPLQHSYQKEQIKPFINRRNLDGLLLASGPQCQFATVDDLSRWLSQRIDALPVVCLGPPVPGFPNVTVDNRSGIRQMVEHLHLVHGIRSFAYMGGPGSNFDAQERLAEYRSTLAHLGLECREDRILEGGFSFYGTQAAWESFFQEGRQIDFEALVCANDEMAITSNQVLTRRGMVIPQDLRITGFDNIIQSELDLPPLTTVGQPLALQVETALDLLLGLLSGQKITELTVLETLPKIRCSCGCLPEALRDIRESFNELSGFDLGQEEIDTKSQSGLKPPDPRQLGERLAGILSQRFSDMTGQEALNLVQNLSALGVPGPEHRLLADAWVMEFYRSISRRLSQGYSTEHWDQVLTILQRECYAACVAAGSLIQLNSCIQQARSILTDLTRIEYGAQLTALQNRLHRLRDNMEHLIFVIDLDGMVQKIEEELISLKLENFHIVLYEPAFMVQRGQDYPPPPPRGRLLMSRKGGRTTLSGGREPGAMEFGLPCQLLPEDLYPPAEHWSMVCSALYFQERQLGYLVYELGDGDPFIYETLNVLISNTIQVSMLTSDRQEAEVKLKSAMAELETYNTRLSMISQTDELTGLYNRRGFLSVGEQNRILAQRMGKGILLFFADMDRLKEINDTLGHLFGDKALKAAAKVLKASFRGMDIISRLGGDEFAILAVNVREEVATTIITRLSQVLDEWNSHSGEPFILSLSIGWVALPPGENQDISLYLNQADMVLYDEKHRKKKHLSTVLRPESKSQPASPES